MNWKTCNPLIARRIWKMWTARPLCLLYGIDMLKIYLFILCKGYLGFMWRSSFWHLCQDYEWAGALQNQQNNLCAQTNLRSSAESDAVHFRQQRLIILGRCPGLSEFSLGTQVIFVGFIIFWLWYCVNRSFVIYLVFHFIIYFPLL